MMLCRCLSSWWLRNELFRLLNDSRRASERVNGKRARKHLKSLAWPGLIKWMRSSASQQAGRALQLSIDCPARADHSFVSFVYNLSYNKWPIFSQICAWPNLNNSHTGCETRTKRLASIVSSSAGERERDKERDEVLIYSSLPLFTLQIQLRRKCVLLRSE